MNEPAIRGEVVQPDYVSQPHSFSAHDFFTMLRDLVHLVPYHNEADRDAAVNAITAYEQHVVPAADLKVVTSQDERAAKEDVTQRVGASPLPATAAGQNIDYARLAAAIVAAQQQSAASAEAPATVITDAAPSNGGTPTS